jgi:hypothetical protein
LEAKPIENIQRVAIDAKASGDFQADIYLSGLKNAVKLAAEILSPEGKTVAVFQSTLRFRLHGFPAKLIRQRHGTRIA